MGVWKQLMGGLILLWALVFRISAPGLRHQSRSSAWSTWLTNRVGHEL
jgi:hypothetical protein